MGWTGSASGAVDPAGVDTVAVLLDAAKPRTRLVGQAIEAVEELAQLGELDVEGVDLGFGRGACGHGNLRSGAVYGTSGP
jgi:hypothetical protein